VSLFLPQIVSGTTPEAEEEAAALFGRIVPEVVRVKPVEAEFSKMFANVYRYLEFVATNQFYMIAQSAGSDYYEVLRAMKHNYPRAARIPGPGFAAGPCLFKHHAVGGVLTEPVYAWSRSDVGQCRACILCDRAPSSKV
jgi:UDP-N-acetyl-D-mannosaminuronic acid dehydrogenase